MHGEPVQAAEHETQAEFREGVLRTCRSGLFQRPLGGSFGGVQGSQTPRTTYLA